jgi:hypothetical protein
MVWRVAQFAPDCETRHAVEVASTGLPCPLVVTVTVSGEGRVVAARFPCNSGAHRWMTAENGLWDQRRIEAELARLRFTVSARTVAKYMNSRHSRGPSSGWRNFPKQHMGLRFLLRPNNPVSIALRFLVVRHVNREILQVA